MSASDLVARLRERATEARLGHDFLWHPANDPLSTEAADALSAHEATIAELRAELDGFRSSLATACGKLLLADKRAEAAEARIAELEKALEPFAEEARSILDHVEDDERFRCELLLDTTTSYFTVGDFRRAARALSPLNKEGDNG